MNGDAVVDVTNTARHPAQKKVPPTTVNRLFAAQRADLSIMAVIFVWVGAAITGNLVAAPAKFQASSLTLPVAMDVGRMQFLWIGLFEGVCVLAVVSLLLAAKRRPWLPLIAGIGLFAVQRVWLMPLLDVRTLAIMAGQPVEGSSLHLIYVATEILKVACLVWAGILGMGQIFRATTRKGLT